MIEERSYRIIQVHVIITYNIYVSSYINITDKLRTLGRNLKILLED